MTEIHGWQSSPTDEKIGLWSLLTSVGPMRPSGFGAATNDWFAVELRRS